MLRLKVILGENKDCHNSLNAWLKSNRPKWTFEVQAPPVGMKGFIAIHKQWVVERTHGRHGSSRRTSSGCHVASVTCICHVCPLLVLPIVFLRLPLRCKAEWPEPEALADRI